jgi:hypothetical protein
MLTSVRENQDLRLKLVRTQNAHAKSIAGVEHGAYLTVHWHCDIHPDDAKYCADKTKHAREGVNLSDEEISTSVSVGEKKKVSTDCHVPISSTGRGYGLG